MKTPRLRAEAWAQVGPVVAVFVCARCNRQNCGTVRRSRDTGRLHARIERPLPVPRTSEQRRPAGLVAQETIIGETDLHTVSPWCSKCRERLTVPDGAQVGSHGPGGVARIVCDVSTG